MIVDDAMSTFAGVYKLLGSDLLVGVVWLVIATTRWSPIRRQPLVWLIRCLLVPYWGLLLGALSPTDIGIQNIDWDQTLSAGPFLLIGVVAIGVIGRATSGLSGKPVDFEHLAPSAIVTGSTELHWCFWRSVFAQLLPKITLTQSMTSEYLGFWLVGLLLIPETMGLWQSGSTRIAASIAFVVTTIGYFYTRNFWLLWLLHWLIFVSLNRRASTTAD